MGNAMQIGSVPKATDIMIYFKDVSNARLGVLLVQTLRLALTVRMAFT